MMGTGRLLFSIPLFLPAVLVGLLGSGSVGANIFVGGSQEPEPLEYVFRGTIKHPGPGKTPNQVGDNIRKGDGRGRQRAANDNSVTSGSLDDAASLHDERWSHSHNKEDLIGAKIHETAKNGDDFADSKLHEMYPRAGESCCRISSYAADCSYCNLSSVPMFLSPSLRYLYLSNNHFTSQNLHPGAFARFSRLLILKLDSNQLTYLSDDLFQGLHKLETLFLNNNSIRYDKALNASYVFKPLKETLTFLKLNRNNENITDPTLTYPSGALSFLGNLTHLYLDGLTGQDFPKEFGKLENLRNLTLAGYTEGDCQMKSLSHKTFWYLTSLQYLNISSCNLTKGQIAQTTFSPLINLQVLDISYNFHLGIYEVGNLMFGLQNKTNFTHLNVKWVESKYAPCRGIFQNTLRHFKNTNLEYIEAGNNELEIIEQGALQLLPPSLKILNLKNNRIIFGEYWKDMGSLVNLQVLHLDSYSDVHKFPYYFPRQHVRRYCSEAPLSDISEDLDEVKQAPLPTCQEGADGEEAHTVLPLPPNLQTLSMANQYMAYSIGAIRFCENSLTYADLSGNVIKDLYGPIHGLGSLKYLTLASSFVTNIGPVFFDHFYSLEYLSLYQNLLAICLYADKEGQIFSELYKLKQLSISYNSLYRLTAPTFKNLKSLEVLDLSVNRLDKVNFTIDHMENLTLLNLTKNQIQGLESDVRNAISKLLDQKKTVRIEMRQNPILCECDNLEFLEWVVKTDIFGKNYSRYYCSYARSGDNNKEMPEGYEDEVIRLRGICKPKQLLLLIVSLATIILLATLLGFVAYRFRWTLRYWYHAAKMRLSRARVDNANAGDFDYDVFVSYSHEDINFILQELRPNLEQRNLRLMLHGDGFQTGRHITDNIYMAVNRCRKTLVVVTRSMLDSYWCTYELQIAKMEHVSTGRSVLVFLMLEEIPSSRIAGDILSYIQTSTYIIYPRNVNHRAAFWDKLEADLRADF